MRILPIDKQNMGRHRVHQVEWLTVLLRFLVLLEAQVGLDIRRLEVAQLEYRAFGECRLIDCLELCLLLGLPPAAPGGRNFEWRLRVVRVEGTLRKLEGLVLRLGGRGGRLFLAVLKGQRGCGLPRIRAAPLRVCSSPVS